MTTINKKRTLSFGIWIRLALGAVLIMGFVAIATGWDTSLFARFSVINTAKADSHPALADEGPLPDLGGAIDSMKSLFFVACRRGTAAKTSS